jgi:hypothetical protein
MTRKLISLILSLIVFVINTNLVLAYQGSKIFKFERIGVDNENDNKISIKNLGAQNRSLEFKPPEGFLSNISKLNFAPNETKLIDIKINRKKIDYSKPLAEQIPYSNDQTYHSWTAAFVDTGTNKAHYLFEIQPKIHTRKFTSRVQESERCKQVYIRVSEDEGAQQSGESFRVYLLPSAIRSIDSTKVQYLDPKEFLAIIDYNSLYKLVKPDNPNWSKDIYIDIDIEKALSILKDKFAYKVKKGKQNLRCTNRILIQSHNSGYYDVVDFDLAHPNEVQWDAYHLTCDQEKHEKLATAQRSKNSRGYLIAIVYGLILAIPLWITETIINLFNKSVFSFQPSKAFSNDSFERYENQSTSSELLITLYYDYI